MTPALTSNRQATRTGRADAIVAVALGVGLLALYQSFRQDAYWGDGRHLIRFVEVDTWRYHHIAYLPVANLFHRVLRPLLGEDPESALFLLSGLASAVAGAFVYLAARTAGCRHWAAVAGSLAMGFSPAAWFYATCIEVHPLQLAVAAGATLWACRAERAGNLGACALVPALFLIGLFTTHMTGILWAPAMAVVCSSRGRFRRLPRHWIAALAILATAALGWHLLNLDRPAGAIHIELARERLLRAWKPRLAWDEIVLPSALLLLPASLFGLALAWSNRRAFTRPAGLGVLLLLATYVPFAMTFGVRERGAYFIALWPVFGLLASLGFDRLRGPLVALAPAVLAGQLVFAIQKVQRWESRYRGSDWIPLLSEELGSRGLVLTLERWEYRNVFLHTRLDALPIDVAKAGAGIPSEEVRRIYHQEVERALARGQRIALTRRLFESPDANASMLVTELRTRHGEPRPGGRDEYLLLPVAD